MVENAARVMEQLTDCDSAALKFATGGLDIGHDQVQALHRARRSRRDILSEDDRATRAGRRELDYPVVVSRCVVDVHAPTEIAIEAFGAIRVGYREYDDLEIHLGRVGCFGLSERRFEDVDVLFDGAAAYADACDPLACEGKRRAAAHRTILSAGYAHQGVKRLSGLHERVEVGGSKSYQR